MLSAMIAVAFTSAGETPRTMAPVIWAGPMTITWPWIIGVARTTPGTLRMRSTAASRSGLPRMPPAT